MKKYFLIIFIVYSNLTFSKEATGEFSFIIGYHSASQLIGEYFYNGYYPEEFWATGSPLFGLTLSKILNKNFYIDFLFRADFNSPFSNVNYLKNTYLYRQSTSYNHFNFNLSFFPFPEPITPYISAGFGTTYFKFRIYYRDCWEGEDYPYCGKSAKFSSFYFSHNIAGGFKITFSEKFSICLTHREFKININKGTNCFSEDECVFWTNSLKTRENSISFSFKF